MQKLLLFGLLLLNVAAFAQSSQDQQDKQWRQEMTIRNGFPAPVYPTTPGVSDMKRVEEMKKSKPITIPPFERPELTKEELEELKKEEARVESLRAPHAEDIAKYNEFLKGANTGMFRLFPDLGCDGKLLVDVSDKCANAVSLSWSYSFTYKYYGGFYDLRLKDTAIVADGFLSQSLITQLGNIDLEKVTLTTEGMKFLTEFKPERKNKKAKEQFVRISKKVSSDGFTYGKVIDLNENSTFGMRVIAYELSEGTKEHHLQTNKIFTIEERKFLSLEYSRRRDKIIAFQIIRKDADGSVTILWKELSDKKAPIIVFDKDEKLTDLKSN